MHLTRCISGLAVFALFSCGQGFPSEDGGTIDAGTIDAGTIDAGTIDAGASAGLTSTAFADGGTISARHSCAGMNLSVPLEWSAIPAAQSYAVVMTDTANSLLHWVIWDIPSSRLALPEGVEKVAQPTVPAGAKQVRSYDGSTYGYLGPCPPATHVYRFELFGLDVTMLPGVTTTSTRAEVMTVITAHTVSGTQTLQGSYTP